MTDETQDSIQIHGEIYHRIDEAHYSLMRVIPTVGGVIVSFDPPISLEEVEELMQGPPPDLIQVKGEVLFKLWTWEYSHE